MNHPFIEYLVCRNNYLDDPYHIVQLSHKQFFRKADYYPGFRTENLLNLQDPETKKFAESFADKLSVDVFPGIYNYSMSLYFHINESNADEILNQGWIHNDSSLLAGLIYLTPEENNFNSGTSIFTGHGNETSENRKIRSDYNLTGIATEEYTNSIKDSWNNFKETIRIGNMFNRLIAYDSKMYHRPNKYSTEIGTPRLTLLFFISKFEY